MKTVPCHGTGREVSVALILLAGVTAAASPAASDSLSIQHQPAHCLVAGKYPQLDACFEPSPRVARARVYFRAEGAGDWYYVEMKPEAPCFRGVLPRPKKSLRYVSYYLAVTDQDFAEARTEEYTPKVVPDEKSCSDGIVAPFLTSASVVVGGATALPVGFVGGGLLAGVGTTAVAAGAAVVGAGAAAVAIGGAGGSESPSSTTLPPTTTTSTTTLPPVTTTTTLGGCPGDSGPPEVQILSPAPNADVGAQIEIVVEASDPGPVSNGIRDVRIYAQEQGGPAPRSASIATLPGPGPTFRTPWTLPPCLPPQDHWNLFAEAADGCGRTTLARVLVKRRQDSCLAQSSSAPAGEGPVLVWTSELTMVGGRGQVIANGSDVLFPGAGRSDLALRARPGRNRLEVVLVGGGEPGTWRFTLAVGSIRPGSLQVLAGEAVAVGPGTAAFRLRGRPGERLVLAFEVE